MNEKMKQLENILCLKGRTFFLQGELKGVLFEMDDFRALLTTFEQIQRGAEDNNES